MADSKLTSLTALSPILSTDLLYAVSDPGGTPASKKVTVSTLFTSPAFTTPSLGVATATSINGNIFTTGSSTYTGTAGQTYTFPTTSATIAANTLNNLGTTSINADLLPASTQKLGSATLPWLSTFTGSTTQYESVVSSAGLITYAGLGSATDIGFTFTPKGAGSLTLSTNNLVLPNGTVSAPSLTWVGQPTWGIYFDNSNTVFKITAAGADRVALATSATLRSDGLYLWASSTTIGNGTGDTGLARNAAGVVEINSGTVGAGGALLIRGAGATHGEALTINSQSELLTLSTSGLTTDTSANLLPANALILAVTCRVTTTITTTTNWAVGDGTTSARFSSANSTLTSGTTSVGLNHLQGGIATDAAGPVQVSAAKVRITCTGSNPGAGVIRITVHYINLTAATS